MRVLKHLFEKNRAWAENIRFADPEFFQKLSRQQSPAYLWIGCSDSRVPANQIVGLLPGEMFVHRNVANVVKHSDLNCMSVLQFAVDLLKVQHIIVCGHYGCAGVRAAERRKQPGMVGKWLEPVRRVRKKHLERLRKVDRGGKRSDQLCEFNVIEQTVSVCRTAIVRAAWGRRQKLAVHGWIYGLEDGLLRDLKVTVTDFAETNAAYESAVSTLSMSGGLRVPALVE
jgi:carbonic anhydrase